MKIVIQRAKSASLDSNGVFQGEIGRGLVAFVGICEGDNQEDIKKAATKISQLRIFNDEDGKMNLSLIDIEGELLLVPNFTLCGKTEKGRRPDFTGAEKPEKAKKFFEELTETLRDIVKVKCGVFGGDMRVQVENDGPVTVIVDTGATRR